MNRIFLLSTVLTSVTGFLFPVEHLLPSHKVGILSLIVLAVAILALYAFHVSGKWRAIYVITAVMALYLNCFVAVVQSFLKIPALHAMAPTGTEPAFLVAQTIVLIRSLCWDFLHQALWRCSCAGYLRRQKIMLTRARVPTRYGKPPVATCPRPAFVEALAMHHSGRQ